MLKFSNENIKERKVVILFLHDSVGELFVTLPIFWFLKNYKDVEIYKMAFRLAMEVHQMTMKLPNYELY